MARLTIPSTSFLAFTLTMSPSEQERNRAWKLPTRFRSGQNRFGDSSQIDHHLHAQVPSQVERPLRRLPWFHTNFGNFNTRTLGTTSEVETNRSPNGTYQTSVDQPERTSRTITKPTKVPLARSYPHAAAETPLVTTLSIVCVSEKFHQLGRAADSWALEWVPMAVRGGIVNVAGRCLSRWFATLAIHSR